MDRRCALALAPLLAVALVTSPVHAASPADAAAPDAAPVEAREGGPVEGPTPPPEPEPEPEPNLDAEGEAEPGTPPPPSIDPPAESGIEFAVPPPEDPVGAKPEPAERPLAVSFPDPGTAPNDGASMLVLSGTTIGLTAVALSAGLVVGLRNQVPLEWLLPSTIVPTVGVLAFAGGGLYLGIKRARAHRRWEIGYRVIGTPQGGGLMVGGSFALLAALGFLPSGGFALRGGQTALGASMLALGGAAAIATPIMFTLGGRRQRDYARTGGWRRRPIPPLPPGAETEARLRLMPLLTPLPGGLSLGAAGRF